MEKFIKGIPKPQPRPRATSHGGRARVYNPPTANEWKSKVMEGLISYAHEDSKEPFILFLTFFMPRPKSHYGTGRNSRLLKANAPIFHTQTPDIDNLTKAVMDAMTVINIWRDDSQVLSVTSTKSWADTPEDVGVEITTQKLTK